MMDYLGDLAAVLLAVSLATERFVVICKTWFAWLGSGSDSYAGPGREEAKSPVVERRRRLTVILLGFIASWVTVSIVAGTFAPWATLELSGRQWPVLLVALLASGGSAFWAQVVAYASALKDVQRMKRDYEAGARRNEPRLPPTDEGSPGDVPLSVRAVQHLQSMHPGIDFVADPEIQTTEAGVRVVHLRQQHAGIPLAESHLSVCFDPSGRPTRVRGSATSVPKDAPVSPRVRIREAAAFAIAGLRGASDSGDTSRVAILSRYAGPSQASVLTVEGMDRPIDASLVYWPAGNTHRLAWTFHIALSEEGGEHDFVVAADRTAPELLDRRSTVAHAASGPIWEWCPDGARVERPLPLPRAHYPIQDPGVVSPSFAFEWVEQDGTLGNNVACFRANSSDVLVAANHGGSLVFTVSDADAEGESQQLLNAFFWCNFLHDFFLLLGFDESAGNFQERNPSGLGRAGDRLQVRVFTQGLAGLASMRSRTDGRSPEMKLSTLNGRPAALDAEVIVHEYAHGVTGRLVGGGHRLDPLRGQEQSEAMDEGYCDYFALSILNHLRWAQGRPENHVFGRWISGGVGTGLRNRTYDGPVGTFRDVGTDGWDRAHDAGQVWAKALLTAQESFQDVLGRSAGDALGWRMVIDSLKLLTPRSRWPDFIDGRDAVYEAFDDLVDGGHVDAAHAESLRSTLAETFLALGLGPFARSDGARYRNLRPDFGS